MFVPECYVSLRDAIEYVARMREPEAVATLTFTADQLACRAVAKRASAEPFALMPPEDRAPLPELREGPPKNAMLAAVLIGSPEATAAAQRHIAAMQTMVDARHLARADLRQALISGNVHAAAVREDGNLVTMRPAHWRVVFARRGDPWRETGWDDYWKCPTEMVQDRSREPFAEALEGHSVPVTAAPNGNPLAWGYPIVARADLARWCGMQPEPEPPERPADWRAPALLAEGPPPGGWTLAETAALLLPSLQAPAVKAPPDGWWMAGGTEANAAERSALRLAFARLMEAGQYVADGIVAGEDSPRAIPLHLWRAATFMLGLPGEPNLPAELCAGGKHWHGVRVRLAAAEPADWPAPAPPPAPAPAPSMVPAGAWWTAEQALSWLAFGFPLRWEDAWKAAGAADDDGERMALAQRQLSDAISARRLPAWGQETADIAKPPLRDTLAPIPPEDFAGPSALTVQMNGWAFPPKLPRRYEGRWWQGIMFEAAEVGRAFAAPEPKAEGAAADGGAAPPEIISTGAPGRPTSMHLIRPEHGRRLDACEAHGAVADESRHLAAWLREKHPNAPPLTPKAIENAIRTEHRRRATRPPK